MRAACHCDSALVPPGVINPTLLKPSPNFSSFKREEKMVQPLPHTNTQKYGSHNLNRYSQNNVAYTHSNKKLVPHTPPLVSLKHKYSIILKLHTTQHTPIPTTLKAFLLRTHFHFLFYLILIDSLFGYAHMSLPYGLTLWLTGGHLSLTPPLTCEPP